VVERASAVISVALLCLEVRISTESPAVRDALRFLVHQATQPVSPRQALELSVQPRTDGYLVRGAGLSDLAPDAASVRETVFAAGQAALLRAASEHALVRGAVLSISGRRVWLVSAPGSGLSTLATHALFAGEGAEGDACALLGADGLTPLPRRFLLRPGCAPLLPGVDFSRLPTAPSGLGVVWGFDPAEAGFRWEIAQGGVDACVWVEPNHGAATRIRAITRTRLLELVISRSSPSPAGAARLLSAVAGLLGEARCLALDLGAPSTALAALADALA
jgi:hypothetical protein